MEQNGPIMSCESDEVADEDEGKDSLMHSKTMCNDDLPDISSKARASRRNRYKTNKLRSAPLTVMTESTNCGSRFNINDHYKLEDRIGIGTYGEVRLGYDLKTDEKVAIKIAKGSTSIKLLENEAKILESLSSKYFAKYISYKGDHKINRGYLIMEYIPGFTLDKAIDNEFKFDSDNILKLTRELALGVQILHHEGICHRDIKPQNVIIVDENNIKIIDFNISKRGHAKFKEKRGDEEEVVTKFYSKFFSQVSSPAYAAPEILTQSGYNESIDIWGIGIIIYGMIFGFDNFQSTTADFEGIKSIKDEKLMNILLAGVDKNPDSRPNIDELVGMLI